MLYFGFVFIDAITDYLDKNIWDITLIAFTNTVNSLLTDTSLRRTLGLIPTVFSRIPYIETLYLYKMDTSIRRTTDTY